MGDRGRGHSRPPHQAWAASHRRPAGGIRGLARQFGATRQLMAQDLFLGIDLGTGGVRACAVDAEAKIAGIATTALPAPRQNGDAIDQDPALWWHAVVETVAK